MDKRRIARILIMVILLFQANECNGGPGGGCPMGTHPDGNGGCPPNVLIQSSHQFGM